jgi:hypothetical protein
MHACRSASRQAPLISATSSTTTAAPSSAVDYYSKLQGKTVLRSSDGAAVDIPSLWQPNERAVVAFGRSFG